MGATVPYLLAVVVIGSRFGRGPALLTTALSVLALDYFVIPPVRQFEITELRHIVMLGGIGSIAVIVSNLTERLRRERERANARDKQADEARRAVEAEANAQRHSEHGVARFYARRSPRSRPRRSFWRAATNR